STQIDDADPEVLEGVRRRVRMAQADQRDLELIAIEPRQHPREQALDAVQPRPGPSEVVADVDDVQFLHSMPCARYQSAVCRRPVSRSVCGLKPSSRRAREISNARLLRKKSTRRR